MTAGETSNVSGSSNSFPLISHPGFGLCTSTSGRSDFGGLGTLGVSSLAAHSQFGALPGTEAQGADINILVMEVNIQSSCQT